MVYWIYDSNTLFTRDVVEGFKNTSKWTLSWDYFAMLFDFGWAAKQPILFLINAFIKKKKVYILYMMLWLITS